MPSIRIRRSGSPPPTTPGAICFVFLRAFSITCGVSVTTGQSPNGLGPTFPFGSPYHGALEVSSPSRLFFTHHHLFPAQTHFPVASFLKYTPPDKAFSTVWM